METGPIAQMLLTLFKPGSFDSDHRVVTAVIIEITEFVRIFVAVDRFHSKQPVVYRIPKRNQKNSFGWSTTVGIPRSVEKQPKTPLSHQHSPRSSVPRNGFECISSRKRLSQTKRTSRAYQWNFFGTYSLFDQPCLLSLPVRDSSRRKVNPPVDTRLLLCTI